MNIQTKLIKQVGINVAAALGGFILAYGASYFTGKVFTMLFSKLEAGAMPTFLLTQVELINMCVCTLGIVISIPVYLLKLGNKLTKGKLAGMVSQWEISHRYFMWSTLAPTITLVFAIVIGLIWKVATSTAELRWVCFTPSVMITLAIQIAAMALGIHKVFNSPPIPAFVFTARVIMFLNMVFIYNIVGISYILNRLPELKPYSWQTIFRPELRSYIVIGLLLNAANCLVYAGVEYAEKKIARQTPKPKQSAKAKQE